MIYLDYSATTPVNLEVLEEFNKFFDKNINLEGERLKIQKLLGTDLEIIYTSGATESNNMAIKGIANKYKESGYRIITTKLEHSSINESLKYLEKKGFIIDYVKLNNGIVDINDLEKIITEKTILITINSVNSETGVLQPINEIGNIARVNNIIFHSDMTQSIGKVDIALSNVDLISLSAHKIYGLKGIGILLKRKNLKLMPLMYGKRNYNSGLVKSMTKALELIIPKLDENYKYTLELNNLLRDKLKTYNYVFINSENSIPHILNISILNTKPETFQHAMEIYDIYLSTKSACSSNDDISEAVLAITNDKKRASTSLRISISYLTTKDEIFKFLDAFDECYCKFAIEK